MRKVTSSIDQPCKHWSCNEKVNQFYLSLKSYQYTKIAKYFWAKYIRETGFYHHTFLFFFMCNDFSFINTTQKTLKPSKKGVSAEIWDASCFKKRSTGKRAECSKHLRLISIFSELTRCIFQTSLKYISNLKEK